MYPIIRSRGGLAAPAAVLLAVAGLLAASSGAAQDASQQAPPPSANPDPNRPVKSPGNAKWAQSAEEARQRAAAENKLVFYEFESPGCDDCRRMQSLLYPAFDFEALLIGMVPVRVRYDFPDSKPLQELYGVASAPSILITTPQGRLVFLMEGFKNAPDFYSHVHKDLDRYRQFARKVDSQDIATLSANEALETGVELYARKDPKAALPRLKRASVAPNPGAGVREAALESLAAVELELGDSTASRKSIDQLIATTKNPQQKEHAELFRAQIPLAENRPEEALALYKKFVKDHPDSKYLAQVQSFIVRLTPASASP
jgi:tetratricopeptide (TPR) repeat protein